MRLGWIDPLFLARRSTRLERLVAVTESAAPDLAITLTSFFSAFITGVVCALAIGFAISLSDYSRKMLLPLLVLGVTIPKVTLLPLFILWFGIAQTPIIVFGALSGFFPMVVNVVTAAAEVKPNQLLLAKAMGFGRFQIFRKVTLPAMLPVLVSGLFYACNASMMGVFIVELALARHGLGAFVHDLAVDVPDRRYVCRGDADRLDHGRHQYGALVCRAVFGRWRASRIRAEGRTGHRRDESFGSLGLSLRWRCRRNPRRRSTRSSTAPR